MPTFYRPSDGAHWTIHFLDFHMRLDGISQAELARKGGFSNRTLESWWRGKSVPNIMNIEVALNAIGYGLKPTGSPKYIEPKRWKHIKNEVSKTKTKQF